MIAMKQLKFLLFLALGTIVSPSAYGVTHSGSCGENVIWTLDTSTGVLAINGIGEMTSHPWWKVEFPSLTITYMSEISIVVISEGVTSIGDMAFYVCSSLTSVIIPESVTSIGNQAFAGCSSLTSITISERVTSIGYGAFSDCSSLTSITIPERVASIGSGAFSGCSNLSSIAIPVGVTSIESSTFSGCSKLTSIIIPEGVTSIGDLAFRGCSRLTSITIPEGVTSIGYDAFYDCSSLTSITIPESVTSIGNYAFYGCSSLTSITIPESLISIGNRAFMACVSLPVFRIPSKLRNFDKETFMYCRNLSMVLNYSSINIIVINKGNNYDPIAVWNAKAHTDREEDFIVCSDEMGKAIIGYAGTDMDVKIPEGITSIKENAFSCMNIRSLVFPSTLRKIEDGAFRSCLAIKSVTVCGNRPIGVGSELFEDKVFKDATLYVPAGTSTLFYVSTGWMNFWNITEVDTKVDGIEMDRKDASIYDLSGRRIDDADAVSGIYIKNGKKVYRK